MKVKLEKYDTSVLTSPFKTFPVGEIDIPDDTPPNDLFIVISREAQKLGYWLQFYTYGSSDGYRYDAVVWDSFAQFDNAYQD